MMGVLVLLALAGVIVGLLVWVNWNHVAYYPPIRPIPKVSPETKAARLKKTAIDAEQEMQAIFFEGYAEMIEEARQARIARLLDERSLR